MHNRLATAALIALLGFVAGAVALVAQPAVIAAKIHAAAEPTKTQSADTEKAGKQPSHRSRERGGERHVRRSAPNLRRIAEARGYKRVSDLVNFPRFFPGLGFIFVKPETLPLGPFLCFDRTDRLVATVYMVPTKDIDDHKSLEAPAFAGRVDHVSFYFNSGHPGVDMPHYHFVIWHVSKKDEARVAK